jgi:hypothetical protein
MAIADGAPPLPEESELARKQAELVDLAGELAQCELDLVTLRGGLLAFEVEYLRTVGIAYAALDEVQAQIAEAEAELRLVDAQAHDRAADQRARANSSARAATAAASHKALELEPESRERLRTLYRHIAKRLHPDLASDELSRQRRQQLMAEVNAAYAEGDERKLRVILDDWMSSPDSVTGDGAGAELVRTLRRIHQVRIRLTRIAEEMAELQTSDLYLLREEVNSAQQRGVDLLAEMAAQVSARIVSARERFESIKSRPR